MYEELVKRLRETSEDFGELDSGSVMLLEAADAIEDLISALTASNEVIVKSKPLWIPVAERLPHYGDWVLGIGPKKGYHVCEYRGITHFPYSGDIPWFSAKGRSLNITHWQPLPQPPKEET